MLGQRSFNPSELQLVISRQCFGIIPALQSGDRNLLILAYLHRKCGNTSLDSKDLLNGVLDPTAIM